MKFYIIFLSLAFIGCKSKQNFELEVKTKQVNYLDVENYTDYFSGEKKPPKESITIVEYSLTNNTDDTYYFNIGDLNRKQNKDYFIPVDKAFVSFSDNNGINVNVKARATENNCTYMINQYFDNNFNPYQRKNSIIIHAHETIYFEWFLVLPFGTFAEDHRYYIDLNKAKSYYGEFYIYGDGHDYANKISKSDLQTIKKNNYKIFNGVIKSKNKIPIVFLKPQESL